MIKKLSAKVRSRTRNIVMPLILTQSILHSRGIQCSHSFLFSHVSHLGIQVMNKQDSLGMEARIFHGQTIILIVGVKCAFRKVQIE